MFNTISRADTGIECFKEIYNSAMVHFKREIHTFAVEYTQRQMKYRIRIHYIVLGTLLLGVWLTQAIPAMGAGYAEHLYPVVAYVLSGFSNIFPFAIGDLFIFFSIVGVIVYPIYARTRKHPWKRIVLHEVEYLLWVYVWFYLAWGLNYSQPNFFQRNRIPYVAYTPGNFKVFTDAYVRELNEAYVPVTTIDEPTVCREAVKGYQWLSDSLAVHRVPHAHPRVKTMVFTPFISKVGVTGSMGPFFCEFTLNGDVLPVQYPATYTHELAHLLGISGEAEASFYAYQVCTRSRVPEVRFSGYFSILYHVLGNARRLMTEEEYRELFNSIRPEIIDLARANSEYWSAKYSPLLGDVQDWVYDWYLKFNKIESGRKNYSEVIGLLISYNDWKQPKK